jgi:hypothetical protein
VDAGKREYQQSVIVTRGRLAAVALGLGHSDPADGRALNAIVHHQDAAQLDR